MFFLTLPPASPPHQGKQRGILQQLFLPRPSHFCHKLAPFCTKYKLQFRSLDMYVLFQRSNLMGVGLNSSLIRCSSNDTKDETKQSASVISTSQPCFCGTLGQVVVWGLIFNMQNQWLYLKLVSCSVGLKPVCLSVETEIRHCVELHTALFKGLFTYYVSQFWGFRHPSSPFGLPPLPPSSSFVSICPTPLY